jgi:hypothetical protein
VYPAGDLIQSLIEIPDRESLPETSVPLVPLFVVVMSSVIVGSGLVRRCVGGHLIF